MKDPQSVLREKQHDLDRLRKEIQALLTVIPLIADDQPSFDDMNELLLALSRRPMDLPDNDMAQLELFYPFIRHLRMSKNEKG